jgi:hypothetical protein
LLNPTSLTWTETGAGKANNYYNEEAWTLLPDGSVLTVDVFPGSITGSLHAERYIPASGTWISAGTTPVSLLNNPPAGGDYEIGPGVLRPDGTVFYVGANPNLSAPCCSGFAHTAIFDTKNNTWSAGPDIPNHDGGNDAPAALLPDGNVLLQAAPPNATTIYGVPSRFYEFNGTTITQVASPPDCVEDVCDYASFVGGMLVLPTGQVLWSGHYDLEIYTPSGSANPAWAPAIASVPGSVQTGATYSISGTQFNGLSQGSAYGDDFQNATNYPLVRITNRATGHVFYARTHDHSTMGVVTGSAAVSTSFDVPTNVESGISDLEVVANGIPSTKVAVVVNAPAITTQPANQVVMAGHTVTLSVRAAGTPPLSYQWYLGTTGMTSTPIAGATASSFTTSAPTSTTSYWVRVSNDYPPPVDSITATLSILITVPAQLITPRPGSKLTGSTVSFQWTSGTEVANYRLSVGTTFGGMDLFNHDEGTGLTAVVTGLPATGSPMFVRLWSEIGGVEFFKDYLYNQSIAQARTNAPSDFDGDGKADITVYRPSSGAWFDLLSGTNYTTFGTYSWGLAGDLPVRGDFDGDGKADIAVYRPSNGGWYVLLSSTNYTTYVSYLWGLTGDVPETGDYDGDGKTDIAVYRPSNGGWYILQSSTDYTTYVSDQWGLTGDIPVPGDYDGDHKTDIAVYRPSNGGWYILQSSTNYTAYASYLWGLTGDVPEIGDYDGDGKTDIAVYRPSNGGWYVLQSSNGYTTYVSYLWGLTGDIPVPADFDGDGKADIAFYRPSNGGWYILQSSTAYSTYVSYLWGLGSDVPPLKRL